MTIDSINIVIYTFEFVVPGYIISEIVAAMMPKKKTSDGEKLVQAIGYSVLNLTLWYWIYMLVQQLFTTATPLFWFVNVLLILLTGCITGVITGWVRAKGFARKLLEKLHIDTSHPIPAAWDYKFSDGQKHLLEVFLANGKVIRGLYSENSFSSSDDEYRDLYIEKLYSNDCGTWEPVERSAGVWISPSEIKYIKFYDMGGNEDEQRTE